MITAIIIIWQLVIRPKIMGIFDPTPNEALEDLEDLNNCDYDDEEENEVTDLNR